MGPVGVQELVVIFLVALVLFGPKKLPELGRTLAKALSEFRRAQSDLKAVFDREMQNLERESESIKEATRQAAVEISGYSEIDLAGGSNSTYGGGSPNPAAIPPTVSASEVPGAESHAEPQLDLFDPNPLHGPDPKPAAVSGMANESAAVTSSVTLAPAEGAVPRNGASSEAHPEAAANAQTHPAEPAQPAESKTDQPETVQHS